MSVQIGDTVSYTGEAYIGPLGMGTVMAIVPEDKFPVKVQFTGRIAPDHPLACLGTELEKLDP